MERNKKVFIKNPYPTRSLDENLADLNERWHR
jgi:hypothetical protein